MSLVEAWERDWAHFARSSTRTKEERLAKGLGILGWTITYIGVILAQEHTKHSLVWGHVVAYNLVWEGFKSFVWNAEDARWITLSVGVGWFGLDLFIALKLWRGGDDIIPDLSPSRRIFLIFLALYMGISYGIHRAQSATMARIWRHCSFIWGNLTLVGFMTYYLNEPYPYVHWILPGAALGNLCYIWSVRNSYRGWTQYDMYPIRALLFITQMVPTIALSLLSFGFLFIIAQ